MVGMLTEQRIQDRRRAPLLRERGVAGRGGRRQRDGEENPRFGIIGVSRIHRFHRARVAAQPRDVGYRPRVTVQRARGCDVVALARRPPTQRRGAPGRLLASREVGAAGAAGDRVAPPHQRQPPIRHRTRRVRFGHPLEGPLAFLPPE